MSTIMLLILLLGLGGYVNAVVGPTDNPSIMIVGDSISHGRDGDFTWRYRLWDWLNTNGISVDFVGPYIGTQQQASYEGATPPGLYSASGSSGDDSPGPVASSGGYNVDIPAGSGWFGDSNHFAAWGRQLAQDISLIGGMVSQYQPDYLLVELGFNDIGWFISDAAGTLESMTSFINNARAAKSDIAFAIANIPQRSFIGGRNDLITSTDEYNAALPSLLANMYTSESPIYIVEFRENYECNPDACPAGSDGLHPNALGEFQIAKAFADTLSQAYGFPGAAFTVPSEIPVRACSTPSNVVAVQSPCGVTVTWDEVPGSYGYVVYIDFVGGIASTWNVSSPGYMTTWTVGGIDWNYQIQAVCSDVVSDLSAQVSATADPTCAPAPLNIRTNSVAGGVSITWDAVEGYDVDMYGAIYWDESIPSYSSDWGFTGTSATFGGMTAGDRVITAVETWANNDGVLCAGLPNGGQGAIVGGVMPSVPSGIHVATPDGGATAVVTWNNDENAYAWLVYTHYLLEPDQPYKLWFEQPQVPCISMGEMFPGTWNYEYCVVAYNGNFSTEMSSCVTGPETSSPVEACPSPAPPAVGGSSPSVTWSNPTPTSIIPSGTSVPGGGGSGSVCTAGSGAGDYADLCAFTCMYGFCPGETCTCTSTGPQATLPTFRDVSACPATGLDDSFMPICQFACEFGFCPTATCQTVSAGTVCTIIPYGGVWAEVPTLSSESTCIDLGAPGELSTAEWDEMTTTTQLQNYLNNYLGEDFLLDFSNPLGVGVSMQSGCSRLETGQVVGPDCSLFTPLGNPPPGTGWEYAVLVAIVNLHNALAAIYTAIQQASNWYTGNSSSLVTTFYPSKPKNNNFLWEEILTGIATAISVATTLTGVPEIGAAGAFFAGVIQEGVNYLSDQVSSPATTTADLDSSSIFWAHTLTASLDQQWENLMTQPGAALPDLFMGGGWLVFNSIPILNIDPAYPTVSSAKIMEWYYNTLVAATINFSWWQGNVYVYCLEMSNNDFTSAQTQSKLDTSLTYYTDGMGCFLQSIDPFSDTEAPGGGGKLATNEAPAGYNDMEGYGFGTADIIAGSVASFNAGGFNYTPSIDQSIVTILNTSPNDLTSQNQLWSNPGIFTLPVCIPPSMSLSQFIANINTPGDTGYPQSWCGCSSVADTKGTTFTDVLPIVKSMSCSCEASECCVPTVDNNCD